MTRISRLAGLALLAVMPAALPAQQPSPTPVLSLQEALDLARQYNPAYLQIANNQNTAGAAVRSAYGDLLPSLSASFGSSFRRGGEAIFQGTRLGASGDVVSSYYGLNLNYGINLNSFIQPRAAAANRDAVEAEVVGQESLLRASVTDQYLTVLQAQSLAALQDTLVSTAEAQLSLARAREAVGSATQLDVTRAEVTLGQQRVAALRAHSDVEIQLLRLFQTIGIEPRGGVQLTSQFPITPLGQSLDELLAMARAQNPVLKATEAREHAASLGVSSARSLYTPSLNISTGWGGYTQQFADDDFPIARAQNQTLSARESCFSQDSLRVGAGMSSIAAECNQIVFTDADAARIRSENSAFPFDFTKEPWNISASISLPIFDGFQREQRVQEAVVARNDARHALRAQELALTADVTAAYLTMSTALRTVELQEQNAAAARAELTLAEERFRVGAATFIEVTQSRGTFETAQNDRIRAIYEYHKAFAALESAVGRPLR